MNNDDLALRSQLLAVRAQRLAAEAQTCGDPERIDAIYAEVCVLRDSQYEIAEEQILREIAEASGGQRRQRWWRRLLP